MAPHTDPPLDQDLLMDIWEELARHRAVWTPEGLEEWVADFTAVLDDHQDLIPTLSRALECQPSGLVRTMVILGEDAVLDRVHDLIHQEDPL